MTFKCELFRIASILLSALVLGLGGLRCFLEDLVALESTGAGRVEPGMLRRLIPTMKGASIAATRKAKL